MHDKFEKEVQQKMEELQLTPSAPVWDKIELEIRPEKTRRRVFVWLFFGLLLMGGGWLSFQLTDKHQAKNETTLPTRRQDEVAGKTNESATKTALPKETVTIQQQTPVSKDQPRLSTVAEKKQLPASGKELSRVVLKKSSDQQVANGPAVNAKLQRSTPAGTTSEAKPEIHTEVPQTTSTPSQTGEKPTATPELTEKPSAIDSTTQQLLQKTETPKTTDTSMKRKVAAAGKWKRRINLSAGISGYADAMVGKSIVMNAGSFQSSPGTVAPIVYKPAETKNGFAFTAGVSLSKELNDHFEISFGLQYAHYSTRTKVGNGWTNDTTLRYASSSVVVDQYFANNGTLDYTNRFHVIELPVSISYQPSARVPLYLSAGAAYGRLIATNALTFSDRSNLYFRSPENFVQHLLPVFGSVQVELFAKGKRPLRLGPAVQYNLLKLRKENPDGEPHLFFAGFKSSVNF